MTADGTAGGRRETRIFRFAHGRVTPRTTPQPSRAGSSTGRERATTYAQGVPRWSRNSARQSHQIPPGGPTNPTRWVLRKPFRPTHHHQPSLEGGGLVGPERGSGGWEQVKNYLVGTGLQKDCKSASVRRAHHALCRDRYFRGHGIG
jgi:hypothetical protein